MTDESMFPSWTSRAGKGLTELLFYMPVWLSFAVYWVPGQIIFLWVASLLVLYIAGTAIYDRWPGIRVGTRWLMSLFIVAAIGAALGLAGGAVTDYKFWGASLICGMWFIVQGSAMMRRGWEESFRTIHMGFGILTYVACIPFTYGFLHMLAGIRLWIAAAGMLSVALTLYIVNDRHLSSESVDGAKSQTLLLARRRNRFMLAGLTVLMIGIAAFRQIQQWIEDHIMAGLRKLFAMLGSGEKEERPPEPPPQSNTPDMLPPMEPSEPARWLVWLEKIMQIIVTIAIVVGVLFLLWWLGRKLAVWFRRWMDKLLQRQSARSSDDGAYTDEVESLMTIDKWRTKLRDRLKRRRGGIEAELDWDELTSGKERMRWLYRQWVRAGIRQGFEPKPYLTPQETAESLAAWKGSHSNRSEAGSFINNYEAARYGEADMTEEQLAEHRRWVERQADANRGSKGKRE